MPSAQVAMTAPSGNICEREGRPSALGHFLSKFGARKSRSKSPTMTLSLKCKASTLPTNGTPSNGTTQFRMSNNDKKGFLLDEANITDVGLSRTSIDKPKRNSSPFARVMHRLSMSRKHSQSVSNERMHDVGCEMRPNLNSSISPLPTTTQLESSSTTSPRPAISESDLRHITLHRGQVLASEITPLTGANPFRSEDNLAGSAMRTPSYLRVSCALNGYRQYRRLNTSGTPLRSPPSALPLSNVQRRLLIFNSPDSQSSISPYKTNTSSLSNEINQPNENASATLMNNSNTHTPTPVRQLVSRFDKLHITSSSEKEDQSAMSNAQGTDDAASGNDENSHLTEHCGTLHDPVTPKSSMPLTSQIPNKVISHSVPEPDVARQVHSILKRTTVIETKPDQSNQSEVVIRDLKSEIMAEIVTNQQREPVVEWRSAEDYQKMFDKTRKLLEKRAEEMSQILAKHENEIPEHAAGALRSAAGNAKLLLKKKMQRFAELIAKNLNPIENDPQPATLDDLAGYWALISMELEDLERLFNEADELRKNNWQVASTSDTKQQQHLSSVNKPSSRVRASESITNKSPATKSNRMTKTNEKEEKNAKNELKRANEAKRRRELIEAMRKQKEKMIKENNIPSGGFSVTTKSSEHFVC